MSEPVAPIRLRDESNGLLASGWINGAGPFVFAIDTGAGVSLDQPQRGRAGAAAGNKSRRPLVGGFSTSPISSDQETRIAGLRWAGATINVPGGFSAAIVANLPGSIDGVLDPTDVFKPFGYSFDLPNRELHVFDTATYRLRLNNVPRDGAVVRWVGSDRPFVRSVMVAWH